MPLNVIKKLTWYPSETTPPTRNEKNGTLPLLLKTGEDLQEGRYSHEEQKFYVKAKQYLPKHGIFEVVRSVDEINKSLEWDLVEMQPDYWMIVTLPK